MRTRNPLTAVLSIVIGLLLATVVALVACAGPTPSVGGLLPDDPEPVAAGPDSDGSDSDGTGGAVRPGGGSGAGNGGINHKPSHPGKSKSPPQPKDPKPPTSSKKPKPVRPAFGKASIPGGASYSVAPDGQTFTMVFSTLAVEPDRLSRTLSTTVPISGDTQNAVVEFAASGFAFATGSAEAKLTMVACGRKTGRVFRSGTEDDYVANMSVSLRGASECTVTLTVESRPDEKVRNSAALLDVLALDAQFL